MEQNFCDNIDIVEVQTLLKNAPTLRDVFDIINKTIPNWIFGTADNFSKDYSTLTENWFKICDSHKVKPTKIIFVNGIYYDDKHQILKLFMDLLTSAGFCIRDKNHFISCLKCNSIIPNKTCYELMKKNNIPAPEKWDSMCIKCQSDFVKGL